MTKINNRRFYNASDAHMMAKDVEEQHQIKELSEVFDKIDGYVCIGEYECNILELSDFQKNWLTNSGYKVSKIDKPGHYTNGMMNIKW